MYVWHELTNAYTLMNSNMYQFVIDNQYSIKMIVERITSSEFPGLSQEVFIAAIKTIFV